MTPIRNSFLLVFFAVLSAVASAQVATGIPPFSSIEGGSFDRINLGNLNVNFAIPIVSRPGRGIPFGFGLAYNSSIWTIGTASGHTAWVPAKRGNTLTWGWQGMGASFVPYLSYTSVGYVYYCGPNNQMNYTDFVYSNFVYHDNWVVDIYWTFRDTTFPIRRLLATVVLQWGPGAVARVVQATDRDTRGRMPLYRQV